MSMSSVKSLPKLQYLKEYPELIKKKKKRKKQNKKFEHLKFLVQGNFCFRVGRAEKLALYLSSF